MQRARDRRHPPAWGGRGGGEARGCHVYLKGNFSKARLREAANARCNRTEIVKALSQGQISRRDLIRMGLMSAAGTLVLTNGLSVFGKSAYGSIPTGAPPSPMFDVQPFSTPMPRFDVFKRNKVDVLPSKAGRPVQSGRTRTSRCGRRRSPSLPRKRRRRATAGSMTRAFCRTSTAASILRRRSI